MVEVSHGQKSHGTFEDSCYTQGDICVSCSDGAAMTGTLVGMIFGLILGYHIALLSGRWKAHHKAVYDQVCKELEQERSKKENQKKR